MNKQMTLEEYKKQVENKHFTKDKYDEAKDYRQSFINDDKMTRRDKFNRLIIDSFAPVEKHKNIIYRLNLYC